MTIKKMIEDELNKRDWKISDLARASKLSPTAISNVLNGNRTAGLRFYEAIAKGFNEPLEKILRKSGIIASETKNEEEEKLLHHFNQLQPEDKKRLIAISKTLKCYDK